MLTVGDPHFVALEAVTRAQGVSLMVIAIRHSTGQDIRQARPRLRFAQAHGAGKTARKLLQGEYPLLRLGAVHHQQIGIARGKHAGADTDRGTGKKRIGGGLYAIGQLHAAYLVVLRRAEHARGGVGVGCVFASLRQDDLFAVEAWLFDVH